MTLPRMIPALFALAASLAAQSTDGDYIAAGYPDTATGGGLHLIDPVKGTMTPLNGVSGDLLWAQSIDQNPRAPTLYYVGTNGADQTPPVDPNIYQIVATGGNVPLTVKLNKVALAGEGRVLDLCVVGEEIIFLTNRRLARLPIAGGTPTTIVNHNVKWPVMTTDGRYLFLNFDASGYGTDSVHRLDLQDQTQWTMIFSPQFPFPTNIRGLSMAADGKVLVLDKGNFSGPDINFIDPITGVADASRFFTAFPPHFDAYKAVEDPKTRDIVVIGSGTGGDQASTWRNGAIVGAAYGIAAGKLRGLTVRRAPWLHRYGHGCKASVADPIIFGNSVPEIGNTKYAFTLEAQPNTGAGLFLLGINGQLPQPVALAPLGMGTCELGVNAIVAFPIAIPASGQLRLPLPIASNMPVGNLDAQMMLLDGAANAAGLITTRVGTIVIR